MTNSYFQVMHYMMNFAVNKIRKEYVVPSNHLTKQELKEKIAQDLTLNYAYRSAWEQATRIFALIKEAGWVELDPDQSFPDTPTTYEEARVNLEKWKARLHEYNGMKRLAEAGWRKVKEK